MPGLLNGVSPRFLLPQKVSREVTDKIALLSCFEHPLDLLAE